MNGIEHIVSPMSAAWCGWTMLVLLLCAILSEVMQPGVILQSPTSLLAQTDRTYKDSPVNLYGQLLISLFRIGTLAMGVYLCVPESADFRFGIYAAICGLTLAMLLVKMLCNVLIDYTFSLSRFMDQTYEHYGDISTLATCTLYPALLVVLRIGDLAVNRVGCIDCKRTVYSDVDVPPRSFLLDSSGGNTVYCPIYMYVGSVALGSTLPD